MSRKEMFEFRLYVADNAQNGALALENLKALCLEHLAGRHKIDVLDVLLKPQRARDDGVQMTPTLIKYAPLPVVRIVGTLSQKQAVLQALGVEDVAA